MKTGAAYSSREEQAKVEIGQTAISRRAAVAMMILFLLTIVAVLFIDQFGGGWRTWRILAGTDRLNQRLHHFESELEDSSAVAQAARPLIRAAMMRAGASGVEKVDIGRENWLFYEPDVRYVISGPFLKPAEEGIQSSRLRESESQRQADPVKAIFDFKSQLAARRIELIVLPTPVKPTIHPEILWPGARGPLENQSFGEFRQILESHGVLVFDPGIILAVAARSSPQYLARDTHWRPEAMEKVAGELAAFVNARVKLPQSLGMEYGRDENQIRAMGDVAVMLNSTQAAMEESVTVHPIRQPNGQLWLPDVKSEILWLGDSFSNIYSAEPMGFGQAAGFAEQFSFAISRPVDALRRNDNGAFATRQMLADELAQGRDRLAGKKLVIWQFATRELCQGDWRLIELKLSQRRQSNFIVPPSGQTWNIQGTLVAQGAAPRPGNVAYRDHILAVHLTHLSIDDKPAPDKEAIVYLRSMTNGKLTPAATLQIGQQIKVKIRDWAEVSRQYEFINRSDLSEESLRLLPSCWGELLP